MGRDDEGPSRWVRKNRFAGTGKRNPRHRGRACHELGNPCYLPRRFPGRRDADVSNWGGECPNKDRVARSA